MYSLIHEIRNCTIAHSSMVLHIGAHSGVEAPLYNKLRAPVTWIEANPRIYPSLVENIGHFEEQRAILALLGSENDKKVKFHIANNDGHSSSILNFGKDMNHQGLAMIDSMDLTMFRLDYVLSEESVKKESHWVIDVQGYELEVLRGSGNLVNHASSMEIEVSTKEEYLGGATYSEVKEFMRKNGFRPLWEPKPHSHEDIFFVRR